MRRLGASRWTACVALALSACAASCASAQTDDDPLAFAKASEGAETSIVIGNRTNLIPPGRDEVDVVVSVEGREIWRAVVRREDCRTIPEVDQLRVPADLPDVCEYAYVVQAGDVRYELQGPDPRRWFIVLHAYQHGCRVGLFASDTKPGFL